MTRPLETEEVGDPDGPVVLAGRYELGELLGRGGMAEVYQAHDRSLGRTVAVKLLPLDRRDDDTDTRRLQEEARAAAALSHANAVSVHDVGSSPRGVFVVMEHLEGRSWREILQERGRLTGGEVAPAAAAVADALAAAHRLGVVHRDVSPSNVMITNDGVAKLMDFGIARAGTPERLTSTGVVVGTAAYMSPEQVRDEDLDGRSDVYSLGCTIYELVTGRVPFSGRGSVETASARLRDPPKPPRDVAPDISRDMQAVVMAALARDPGDRPDARDLAERLRALGGSPGPGASAGREATTEAVPPDPDGTGPTATTTTGTTTTVATGADTARTDTVDASADAPPGLGGPDPTRKLRRAGAALVTVGVVVLVVLVVLLLIG